MGLMDILFPREAKNRKAIEFRKKHEKAAKDFTTAYNQREERLRDSVAAKSLDESISELYSADKTEPLGSRKTDLDWYRQDVLNALDHNYERGNLEGIADAISKLSQSDSFTRSFLYQTGERKTGTHRRVYTSDGEPDDIANMASSLITFDPRTFVSSAKRLVDLAKKAYWSAEHEKVLGYGRPANEEKYKAGLNVGGKVYQLLNNSLSYLIQSKKGYEALSEEHKKALREVGDLLYELKKENSTKAIGVVSMIGLLGGAFFFSTKITGNVVGMSGQTSSLIGVGLLIIGIIAGLFWLRKKKENKIIQKKKASLRSKKK